MLKEEAVEFVIKREEDEEDDGHKQGILDDFSHCIDVKVLGGISYEEVMGMHFNSIEEAEAFYNMYSKVAGFSIRKDDAKRDKKGGIIYPKWVCSKQGYRLEKCLKNESRQRGPRPLID